MQPIDFPQKNKTLIAPEGISREDCQDLHVYSDGESCTSCWQASPAEIALFNRTGRFYVTVWFGKTQPPIMIQVVNPLLQPMEEDENGLGGQA